MHINQLGTPFRRFHIAPVWRAEKPQKGRFREFTQCDFDILGSTSASADAEVLEMIHRIFSALGVQHKIRINHRALLNGFMQSLGTEIAPQSILRVIDKLDKLGADKVQEELSELGLPSEKIELVFAFLAISKSGQAPVKLLEMASELVSSSELATSGIERLDEIQKILSGLLPDANWALDFSIARGLDYYTGVVFETQAIQAPEIGSICSGGRYDDLTTLYSKKAVPGVGGSVGLDRTLTVLEELGLLATSEGGAQALVFQLDSDSAAASAALAHQLRSDGVATELYPQVAKIGAQFKYAERKNIRYAVIAGATELASGTAALKDIRSGEQQDAVSLSSLAKLILK
ncbi:UNVERIFIED_CONTAM: hypothetical protein GTU68_065563 [Idotea baltica]|nr:hypothetical protein [Idotea baltica]